VVAARADHAADAVHTPLVAPEQPRGDIFLPPKSFATLAY
jgi:hypothetical protein